MPSEELSPIGFDWETGKNQGLAPVLVLAKA